MDSMYPPAAAGCGGDTGDKYGSVPNLKPSKSYPMITEPSMLALPTPAYTKKPRNEYGMPNAEFPASQPVNGVDDPNSLLFAYNTNQMAQRHDQGKHAATSLTSFPSADAPSSTRQKTFVERLGFRKKDDYGTQKPISMTDKDPHNHYHHHHLQQYYRRHGRDRHLGIDALAVPAVIPNTSGGMAGQASQVGQSAQPSQTSQDAAADTTHARTPSIPTSINRSAFKSHSRVTLACQQTAIPTPIDSIGGHVV